MTFLTRRIPVWDLRVMDSCLKAIISCENITTSCNGALVYQDSTVESEKWSALSMQNLPNTVSERYFYLGLKVWLGLEWRLYFTRISLVHRKIAICLPSLMLYVGCVRLSNVVSRYGTKSTLSTGLLYINRCLCFVFVIAFATRRWILAGTTATSSVY